MSWGRQDDGYYDHPKVVALTLEAIGLEWIAIAYANRHHTDGVMSLDTARYLARGDRTDLFAQLVQFRRWTEQKSPDSQAVLGYVIHDFLDYNESAKEWEQKKKQAVKRMRRLRKRSPDVRANFATRSPNVPGRDGNGSGVLPKKGRVRGKPKKRSPEVPWPEDFTLTDDMLKFAMRNMTEQEARTEFVAFKNWALSKDWRYANWIAGWHTRCINFVKDRQLRLERRTGG